jgi:hypothetical protein
MDIHHTQPTIFQLYILIGQQLNIIKKEIEYFPRVDGPHPAVQNSVIVGPDQLRLPVCPEEPRM